MIRKILLKPCKGEIICATYFAPSGLAGINDLAPGALPLAFAFRPFGAGKSYFLPAEIMFTKRRYAPGTPAGSWRKKASEVKTYVPRPTRATRVEPFKSCSPGSWLAKRGV